LIVLKELTKKALLWFRLKIKIKYNLNFYFYGLVIIRN